MTMKNADAVSLQRRRFLAMSARFGFATAIVGATSGLLFDDVAMAQLSADEAKRVGVAKVKMLFASEY